MQSIALITLAVLAVSITATPVEENKICLKTTDACKEFAKVAKAKIHDLRSLKIEDPKTDIPLYLTKLQELLIETDKSECRGHVEVCKCENNALTCSQLVDKLRAPLAHVELPACLENSPKAAAIVTDFKKAVAEGNRAGIIEVLGKIRGAIDQALATKSDKDSEELVTCLRETVKGIRTKVDAKLNQLKPRPNCDFCVTNDAPSSPAVLHAHA